MRKEVRLGVVGCGWAGRQTALAGTVVPGVRVTAVSDVVGGLRDTVAAEFGVPGRYGDYRELLADPQVDAVALVVNPATRYQMVFDSLAAGKHVLVQKPHAVRAGHILEFEAAAAKADRTLQFCYFRRHFPEARRIRAAVAAGAIGRPYHARIFLKFNFLPPADGITRWLQVWGQKGGALGQHASHELDLAWWWMGCPEPEWAFAAAHAVYPAYGGPEGPAEDYFSGLVGLAGGLTIQIDCSRWLHSDSPTLVELYGSEGAIAQGKISRYAGGEHRFEEAMALADDPPIPHTKPPDPVPPFFYEVEHFALAVAGRVEPEVSVRQAHTFLRILDGLYDSAARRERVELRAGGWS